MRLDKSNVMPLNMILINLTKVRVVAEEKYDIIRELLDTNMVFRILHNNLDQMVAESIHKVTCQNHAN